MEQAAKEEVNKERALVIIQTTSSRRAVRETEHGQFIRPATCGTTLYTGIRLFHRAGFRVILPVSQRISSPYSALCSSQRRSTAEGAHSR
jgi:hypothetical protein